MADNKKTKIYFWLKLDENFYKNIIIKKARKTNDTMVIVYQRLMLQSLATNGYLYYEGAFENIADELAMSLDEDVEQVQMTLAFFSQYGLIQFDDENNAEMLQVHALIDQETNWARYRRDSRKKEKVEKLDNVQPVSNQCPTEIELEIEKELKIDIESEVASSNSNLQKLSNFYQENFGVMSSYIAEELKSLCEDYGFDLTLEAMKRAITSQKTFRYSKGILKNWDKNGIKTLDDAMAETAAFERTKSKATDINSQPKAGKKLPEWSDEAKLIKAGIDTTGMSQNEMYHLVREKGLANG
ncbi:DnaD domain protein [Lactococcus petauri]|uniref:DnaD domain protein n=1 Tax=Lactococcus TaxID=1357 RepID=UPI0018E0D15D|nr:MULTISPECIES: DnaD domain protein [Lactococcus]MDG6135639.1 DnaD domain protein [Lactococcus petauri]QQC58116.1 phage replisome organizer N-terminal domain-containing protein [Lactococcus garvieae]UHU65324.1 DnaD domain protein [Lactococcus garvieae]USI71049.1 DnaD domain protein [Lactococcus garvieae subsp. garvieae]